MKFMMMIPRMVKVEMTMMVIKMALTVSILCERMTPAIARHNKTRLETCDKIDIHNKINPDKSAQ